MRSENNLAGFYDPRGLALPGHDQIFATEIATLADIKAARNLDKWTIQTMRDPGMPAVYKAGGSSNVIQGLQARVANKISADLAWCNAAVDAQLEYMAMHALQGNITWPPVDNDGNAISPAMPHWNADMVVNIPFNLPANQNQAATTLTGYNSRTGSGNAWTSDSATPFNDLSIINEYMIKTLGVPMHGGRIVMSHVVLEYLTRNTDVLNWLAASDRSQPGARQFADLDEVRNAIKTKFGWTIETYDSQWTYATNVPTEQSTITRVDYLKEGRVLIFPPSTSGVGNMLVAPQESEPGGAWIWGKMGWSYTDPKPPFDVELGVNAVAWPKFEQYDWFLLDSYN
jgi:hypothetical protein